MVQCTNCLMELQKMFINERGECVFCALYKKKWVNMDFNQSKIEFEKILDFYKEKNTDKNYDCLVPISGGKDSIYLLYLACREYGMRPLAFTYDNWFQTYLAKENIKNAVTKLGVDHITYSPSQEELRMMYREFFCKTNNMCTVCNQTIIATMYQAAAKETISLILIGHVSKLENAPIYGNKRYCQEDIFKKILDGNVPSSIYNKYTIKDLRKTYMFHPLFPFDYIDYDYNTVLKVVKGELDWKEAPHGDTKVDCRFYTTIGYFKYQQNKINSKILNTSALLRDGQISQNEFYKRIVKVKDFYNNMNQDDIKEFFDYIRVKEDDLKNAKHLLDYVQSMISDSDFDSLNELEKETSEDKLNLIQRIIDIIRPEVKRDGGDIKIVDFSDNKLRISLLGGCRGCLQGELVIRQLIETLINSFLLDTIFVDIIQNPEIGEWK